MPIDVAMVATDVPIFDAIFVMFGNALASNFIPTEFDRYVPNSINLFCSVGSIANNSENIGRICVMNKYIIPSTVNNVAMWDKKLNVLCNNMCCVSDESRYGNTLRGFSVCKGRIRPCLRQLPHPRQTQYRKHPYT